MEEQSKILATTLNAIAEDTDSVKQWICSARDSLDLLKSHKDRGVQGLVDVLHAYLDTAEHQLMLCVEDLQGIAEDQQEG